MTKRGPRPSRMPSRSWKTSTWPSVSGPGADADHGHLDVRHQLFGDGARDRLEDDREAAASLQRQRLGADSRRRARVAPLRLPTAQRGRALRRQADVAHHGDPGLHDRARAAKRSAGPPPSSLTASQPASLTIRIGARDRLLVADLIGAERQIADHQRRAAARGARRGRARACHRGPPAWSRCSRGSSSRPSRRRAPGRRRRPRRRGRSGSHRR